MASRVDIANLALTKLGSASKITSLTDNSVAARALNGVYDIVRKAEIRSKFWSFALKRASLPALATVPDWGYGAAYQLPSDYLRIVQVNEIFDVPALNDYNDGDMSPWAIESGAILTDFPAPLKIRYIWDVTDEGTFDALFVMSFACRLAYECCEQITNSNAKKAACKDDYMTTIKEAVKVGAIEKPPAPIPDDSWIMSRL